MGSLNFRLKAATLLESLVAMVIIIVGLGVGTMIYTNVLNADKQLLQMKAMGTLNRMAVTIKKEHQFLDEVRGLDGFTIKKSVDLYDQTQNLYVLSLAAFDEKEKLLAIRKELITIE